MAPNRPERGFTLIELLIVVAIIGIIAAIAIPSLLRARVSANESGAVGDVRTVISSEAAFHASSGGYYGDLTCLATPAPCIPNYSATAPTFLDSTLGGVGTGVSTTKSGYNRTLFGLPAVTFPAGAAGYMDAFSYAAIPAVQDQTGVRGFAGDSSGRICVDTAGADPSGGAASLPAGCTVIQ